MKIAANMAKVWKRMKKWHGFYPLLVNGKSHLACWQGMFQGTNTPWLPMERKDNVPFMCFHFCYSRKSWPLDLLSQLYDCVSLWKPTYRNQLDTNQQPNAPTIADKVPFIRAKVRKGRCHWTLAHCREAKVDRSKLQIGNGDAIGCANSCMPKNEHNVSCYNFSCSDGFIPSWFINIH